MYKLSRRRNLIPFVALMAIGLAACMLIPQRYPENVFEIPAFALFPAEIALVMMLSVLFFENATPAELLRLSFTMLSLVMFAGGMGNVFGRTSQTLPDQTLLLNWVQLLCMNISGLITTIAFYQTKTPAAAPITKAVPIREVAPVKSAEAPIVEGAPPKAEEKDKDPANGESVQDILNKLDVNRINSLESSLKKTEQGSNVSLESLFADESTAAAGIETSSSSPSLEDLLGDGVEADSSPVRSSSKSSKVDMTPPPAEPKPLEPVAEAKETATATVAPPKAEGKLFDDVSGDLEDIFADLASGAANDELTAEKLAEVKSTVVAEPPVAETKAEAKQLIDVSDNEIDDIFANIISEEAPSADLANLFDDITPDAAPPTQPAPAAPVAEAPPQQPSQPVAPREVKEFGRLSAVATSKSEPASVGTLKTIGQMLLDTQAIENIIKHSEAKGDKEQKQQSAATARVVSVSRGADIQAMLDKIAELPEIDGCLVIGKDGLLIGATQSLGMMRDVYGVLSLGMHSTTNLGTKKIDLGDLRQSIMRCGNKVTFMTEIGIGVLAAFSDNWDLSKVDLIIDHIGKTVMASQSSGGASLPMETLSGGLLSEPLENPSAPAVVAAAPVVEVAPEPVVEVAAEPEGEAQIPITEMKGGLLNVNDDDIGGLFDNVLADPTVQNDAIGEAAQAAATAEAAQAASDKALLNVSDADMADIFDSLMDEKPDTDLSMDFSPAQEQAPAPVEATPEPVAQAAPVEAAPAEAPAQAAPAADVPKPSQPGSGGRQIKEFGRLSASTAAHSEESQGAIKAIGRQLIDVQAVENIIKSGEKREKMGAGLTTARVISQARGEGIKALLTKIDGHAGVKGSLIVGNDGMVIASTLTGGLDKDLLGALCTAMHGHTDLAAKKLDMGKLKQIIFHTDEKLTVLTGVAVGVLAVFVDNVELSEIDSLLNAIEGTVRG